MKNDKYGMASLILGILAVLLMLVGSFLGFILMVLTFVFSVIQLKNHKNNLAITGLVLGFVALGLFLLDAVSVAQVSRDLAYQKCLEENQYTIENWPELKGVVCPR